MIKKETGEIIKEEQFVKEYADRPEFSYRLLRVFFKPLVYLLFHPKVYGLEKIPDGPVVLALNHRYASDPVFIVYAYKKRPIRYLAAKKFHDGIFGFLFRMALTVPVEKSAACIKDICISDHGNWRHLHWNALQSAYGESPFFEYYQDDIRPFFEERWTYLLDFNEAIRQKMCELIDIQPEVTYSTGYVADSGSMGIDDFRSAINPKHPIHDNDFETKTYYQVYQMKHGFLSNLSVLDLLFNMGPESIFYL